MALIEQARGLVVGSDIEVEALHTACPAVCHRPLEQPRGAAAATVGGHHAEGEDLRLVGCRPQQDQTARQAVLAIDEQVPEAAWCRK